MTGRPNLAYLWSIAAVGLVVGLMPRAQTASIERSEPEGHGRAMNKAGGSGEGSGSGTENANPATPAQKPDETEPVSASASEETPSLGILREETLPVDVTGERRYFGTFPGAPVQIFDMHKNDTNKDGSEESSVESLGELLETE